MGIFSRLSTIFRANANAAIDKMEDPEKVLNQLIIDMQEQLATAKKQVATAIADEKRLKLQLENETQKAQEWEQKAMQAVRAGRDDLANDALARKAEHDKYVAEYTKQWQAQKAATDKLRDSLKGMSNKIEEAKRKKGLLIAREKRAKAQKTIQSTLSGISDNGAMDAFNRMAEKVEQNEAEAEAHTELAEDFVSDDLEKQIDALPSEATQSDALAALKAKMGATSAPAKENVYSYDNVANPNMKSWDDEKF